MSGWFDRALERRVLQGLEPWAQGRLRVTLPDGQDRFFGPQGGEPLVDVRVHDNRLFRRVALANDIGMGEAYMEGEWSTSDLPALISAFIANRDELALDHQGWLSAPARVANWIHHRRRANTERGSERNIHAHYDLGNEFYRLFLDETLAYSSAIFPDPAASLEDAQRHKYQVICQKLALEASDHLLEIGSGWGGFAIYAAKTTGCRITTVTISREQFAYAKAKIAAEGLCGQIDIQYCDYRHIEGKYTKVVSIEMLEAVGQEYWDDFFRKIDAVLRGPSAALIQVICVPDQRFDSYNGASDWIRKYVFPGGRLPSLYELQHSVRRATRLEMHGVEDIGLHYAPTLRMWRERFWKNAEVVRGLEFSDSFLRLWDFYLASCEASFATRWNRNLHLVLNRPSSRAFCG